MRYPLLVLVAVILVGCAARPSDIQPAMVSRTQYSNMECDDLNRLFVTESNNLGTLSAEQLEDRGWDIALNILLIPGLGALTADKETEIAQSKGRILAIEEAMAERC